MKVLDVVKKKYDVQGRELKETLLQRGYEAYYVNSAEEAKELALSLIDKEKTVSWGGSSTIAEIGLQQYIRENGYKVIDRDLGKTKEEKEELMRLSLLSDYFLMSTNAITKEGDLLNIDGRGNRVAALCYGPRNIIMIVGMNKVVGTIESAYDRVKNICAPINTNRLGVDTPCRVIGFCQECHGQTCVCSHVVITRQCKPTGRIKVILVGEDLGF